MNGRIQPISSVEATFVLLSKSGKRKTEENSDEQIMKTNMGLWIDHRQAIIVRVFEHGEELKHLVSNLPKRVRFWDAEPHHHVSSIR